MRPVSEAKTRLEPQSRCYPRQGRQTGLEGDRAFTTRAGGDVYRYRKPFFIRGFSVSCVESA